jgi:hypothetical protein
MKFKFFFGVIIGMTLIISATESIAVPTKGVKNPKTSTFRNLQKIIASVWITTLDQSIGLNGICDFLISLSTQQLIIEAPAVVIVEAKKENLKGGLGQCMAEMVAAQRFNEAKKQPTQVIYGVVTSGNLWTFLKLEKQILTIDFTDYFIPPVERILGILVWMIKNN